MSTRISGHSIIYDSSSSYCSITRSGWHLPQCGVAVVSQVLCTSTTLNKRNTLCFLLYTRHLFHTRIYKIYPDNTFVKGNLGILCFFNNLKPLTPSVYQPTLNLNFWISFSLDTRSISAPRLRSFCSKFSYPR